LFKPKTLTSNIPGITLPVVTSPLKPTTSSTTLPSLNFSKTKGDVINYKLDIDITGSPIILSTIKKEASTLGTPNQIKIIEPTIKGQKLTSKEVLQSLIKNVPQSLSDAIKIEYIVYTYYGEVHPALGLIFDIDTTQTQEIIESMLL